MYTLLRSQPVREILARQIPILVASFVIAEVFYKFHSYTLESAAFLATWFALDWTMTRIAAKRLKDRSSE